MKMMDEMMDGEIPVDGWDGILFHSKLYMFALRKVLIDELKSM